MLYLQLHAKDGATIRQVAELRGRQIKPAPLLERMEPVADTMPGERSARRV